MCLLGVLRFVAAFRSVLCSGLWFRASYDYNKTPKICYIIYDGLTAFYGKLWHTERTCSPYEIYVQRRPHVIHNRLYYQHACNPLFHVHSWRTKRLYLCDGCVGWANTGAALLFGELPAWGRSRVEDLDCSHVSSLATDHVGLCKSAGHLYGTLLQVLGSTKVK